MAFTFFRSRKKVSILLIVFFWRLAHIGRVTQTNNTKRERTRVEYNQMLFFDRVENEKKTNTD